MGRLFNVVYHFVVFCVYLYSTGYNFIYVRDPNGVVLGNRIISKLMFLTVWGMIIQTLFFGISLVNSLVGSNLSPDEVPEKRSSCQKFRDFFAATIVFPIGSFVAITFWTLYAIDRQLVFPKELDAIVPAWLNHVMHTTVVLFLLIEKVFVYHHYPSRAVGLPCTIGFALIYQLWMFWIAFYADLWIYPILMVLSWPGRLCFLAACWFILIMLYLAGETITAVIWRTDESSVKKRK